MATTKTKVGTLIGEAITNESIADEFTLPILKRAKMLETVDQALRSELPEAMWVHVRLANVVQDKLVFVVASPIWAAKLRLSTAAMIVAAQKIGLKVTGVSVKVSALPLREPETTKAGLQLTEVGAATLKNALRMLQKDMPAV